MSTQAKTRPRPGGNLKADAASEQSKDERIERLRRAIIEEAGPYHRVDPWAIQRWAMSQTQVPTATGKVLLALAVHADQHGYCEIRSKTLAAKCGYTGREHTMLWKHIARLKQAGLLAVQERYSDRDNGRLANGYWLPFWRLPVGDNGEGSLRENAYPPCAKTHGGPCGKTHSPYACSCRDPLHKNAPLERQEEKARRERPSSSSSSSEPTTPDVGTATGGSTSTKVTTEKKIEVEKTKGTKKEVEKAPPAAPPSGGGESSEPNDLTDHEDPPAGKRMGGYSARSPRVIPPSVGASVTSPAEIARRIEARTLALIAADPLLSPAAASAASQHAEAVGEAASRRMAVRQAVHADQIFLARKQASRHNRSEGGSR
jgi:hypothetical protein